MESPSFQSPCQTPQSGTFLPKSSENLEDQFWAALRFAIEGTLPCTSFDPKSPLAPPNTSNALLLHQSDARCGDMPRQAKLTGKNGCELTKPIQPTQHNDTKNIHSLRVKVPPTRRFVSATVSPITAIPRSALSPSAGSTRRHLQTPRGIQSSTPISNLVSNFLDSIVLDSESGSFTPIAAVPANHDGDGLIVESEVVVQVVEEINWMDFSSPIGFGKGNGPIKLNIPSSPIAVPTQAGCDIPFSFAASGPASCAQELDALWWMRWDRQLSNVQCSLRPF